MDLWCSTIVVIKNDEYYGNPSKEKPVVYYFGFNSVIHRSVYRAQPLRVKNFIVKVNVVIGNYVAGETLFNIGV